MPDWPSLILVDLDNTLHDYRGAAKSVRSSLADLIEREYGVPSVAILARYEQLLANENDANFASGRESRVARLERLLGGWPETHSAEAGFFADFMEAALFENIRPFEGAVEACRVLKTKAPVMILTEGYSDTQGAVLRRLGLSLDARDFLATKPHKVRKADGSAFRLACDLHGAAAGDSVMIGDNWDWDILGAAMIGLPQIWVGSSDQDRLDPPHGYLGKVAAFRETPAHIEQNWNKRIRSCGGCG
jgi:putative hydrolase of the HAD superfamily